jgi:hypothetical protein
MAPMRPKSAPDEPTVVVQGLHIAEIRFPAVIDITLTTVMTQFFLNKYLKLFNDTNH